MASGRKRVRTAQGSDTPTSDQALDRTESIVQLWPEGWGAVSSRGPMRMALDRIPGIERVTFLLSFSEGVVVLGFTRVQFSARL